VSLTRFLLGSAEKTATARRLFHGFCSLRTLCVRGYSKVFSVNSARLFGRGVQCFSGRVAIAFDELFRDSERFVNRLIDRGLIFLPGPT